MNWKLLKIRRKKIFYKEELNLREDSENIDVYKHLLNNPFEKMMECTSEKNIGNVFGYLP